MSRIVLLILFLGCSSMALAQLRNAPFSTTKNYISYRLGVAYPFLSEGNIFRKFESPNIEYALSNFSVNYGLQAGVSLAHFFGDKFYMKVAPAVMFTKFSATDYQYNFYKYSFFQTRYLSEEHHGVFHYHNWAVLFPVDFDFRIKEKLDFGAGLFLLQPFNDSEHKSYSGTLFYTNPPHSFGNQSDVYKNRRRDTRAGYHIGMSLLLKERDWHQKRINLEF